MKQDHHSLRTFVERWIKKSEDAQGQPYAEFDRFIFTYIAFNALYNAAVYVVEGHGLLIATHKWSRGGIKMLKAQRYRVESVRASELVVKVCGTRLREILPFLLQDIHEICECFGPNRLYLYEKPDGKPDFEADQRLVQSIRNGSAASLLKLIYLVRCNLFHGSKALSDVQDRLLNSSTFILQHVIELMLSRIEEHGNPTTQQFF